MSKDSIIRFLKFGIVGGSGVFVNQGMFMILGKFTSVPVEIRSPIAIAVAIITNFLLNYYWTWRDRKSSDLKHIGAGFLKFAFSSGVTAFIFNYLPLLFMVNVLNWNDNISNIIGIGVASVANFLISHFWTFKKK